MIKKYYRKLYRAYLGKPMSKDEFDHVLKNLLGLSRGDSVLVHSSFGNLKAGFSPKEAVELLMEIVGQDGNILMPYYPEDSRNWLEQGKVFDVKTTPTRSGILSATFASFPEVKKSLHPIKSLAVWGKDRDYLISTHHESVTPFDEKSPYYKLFLISERAKTIGLGSYKNSFFHCAEDIIKDYPKYYSNKALSGFCINYSGETIEIRTPFHISEKLPRFSAYLIGTGCPNYIKANHRNRIFYAGQCRLIASHLKEKINQGLTPKGYLNNKRKLLSLIENFQYRLNG